MVSPVARAVSAADPASQSAGLYRERNIPEHPRTVEAIIWSNVERSDSPKCTTDARSLEDSRLGNSAASEVAR